MSSSGRSQGCFKYPFLPLTVAWIWNYSTLFAFFPKSSDSFALFVFNHLVYLVFNHLVYLVFNHLVSFFLCCFRWSHTLRWLSSHRLFQREPSSRPWQCRSTTTRWWTRSARMQTFCRRLSLGGSEPGLQANVYSTVDGTFLMTSLVFLWVLMPAALLAAPSQWTVLLQGCSRFTNRSWKKEMLRYDRDDLDGLHLMLFGVIVNNSRI